MIRFGLCCMFHSVPIKFRTTTAAHCAKMSSSARLDKLGGLCLHNACSVLSSLEYCAEHSIGSFRLSSDLFPLKTHPELGYRLVDLPQAAKTIETYIACGDFACQNNIRLGIHPDQFVVLNSNRESVVDSAIKELNHHNDFAEMIGADTINIHAGGVYGDKPAALARLRIGLSRLSSSIRSRLTLENDDKSYTPEDLLPLCLEENVPLVYDVHHHRCLPDSISVEEATIRAIETWGDKEPLFHISSSKSQGRFRDHADLVLPQDVPLYWINTARTLTVEVEAKHKEVAVLALRQLPAPKEDGACHSISNRPVADR